ncbi:MAG: VOC family protein [Acidiferrobacterales bacterium]
MPLKWLDHVTLRTANLEAMRGFYENVLGLSAGPRPPFSFNGSWLYWNGKAVVHLVETVTSPAVGDPRIEHFAFRAVGLQDFLAALKSNGVSYRTAIVPDLGLKQVHLADPDGNHVEVNFSPDEPMGSQNLGHS